MVPYRDRGSWTAVLVAAADPRSTPAVPHPFLDHDGPLAFAHRGGAADGLENTLPAFERAVRVGCHVLETDVHATADGVLVAFHDATLDRVTDRTGAIERLTWAEVARARVGGRHAVPRLDELITTFPGVRWNLDVKAPGAVAPLIDRLRGDTDLLARTCVGSFSGRRLAQVRLALGRAVCTSASPREVLRFKLSLRRRGRRLVPLVADCLQVPVAARGLRIVDRRFVAAAADRGLPVHVWTINDRGSMHRLLDLGVHGLVTDHIDLLRDVLLERGSWTGSS
jgi:glycerophosphoryl diester phosphodiesterase